MGKKSRSSENQKLLDSLEAYIIENEADFASDLTMFWTDQATAITYQELQNMVEEGDVSEELLKDWKMIMLSYQRRIF